MSLKRLLKIALPLFIMTLQLGVFAQVRTITGKVADKDGNGIPGATVTIKGTQRGVSTSADGTFAISIPDNSAVLVISSIGFARQEVPVGELGEITVSLANDNSALGEVVVVGYGTQRKKDLTGAVTLVTAKDFQKGNITTPEQMIAGKVAGVQITGNGGAPGAGSTIRIRSGASLNATNDPLIVVDGVPLDNSGISGAANGLALINPNDIESFNVLKDASATAIFGSRASNGVIIITTKKGKRGAPTFNFSTQLSVAKIADKIDLLSPTQIRAIVQERGNDDQVANLGNANTDWQDEIYRQALTTDNNFSASGSIMGMPYRASLGYLNQQGVLTGGTLKRNSASINLSPRFFNDHLKVDLNVRGAVSRNDFANEGAIGGAINFDPTQPVKSGKAEFGGYYEWLDNDDNLINLATRNPVGLLNTRIDKSIVERSLGNIQFDYKFHFLPDLRANLNLGYDVSQGEGTVFVPAYAAQSFFREGVNNNYLQSNTNKLMDFYLNYVKNIKSIDSRIDLMAGYSYQDFKTKNFAYPDRNAAREIIPNSEPLFPFDIPQYTLISFFGRANYAFKGKYLVTATLRRDGSSRFSPDNRWGMFPSVAFAWRASDEEFLKNSDVVSDLKFRVGYGVTGQQDIGSRYPYLPIYTLSTDDARYQLGDTYYNMYRPNAYDPNIKWEETSTFNVGVDFGFLSNRISGSVEYFKKESTDLLSEIFIPAGSNFSNKLTTNVGSLDVEGVEFTLNTTPVSSNDFSWDIGFNATYQQNEITNLSLFKNDDAEGNRIGGIAGGTGNTVQINSVGYNRAAFYLYQQVYDANGRPVEGAYVDQNGDGSINQNDLVRSQGIDPTWLLGLSSNLNWKKWSAGFVMRANIDNYMYNNVFSGTGAYRNILNPGGFLSNGSSNVLETNFYNNQYLSDYYLENASFLRMDNINLGYNFGKVFNSKVGLRLNANVQNVFVVTKYQGIDPEINGGIDNNFYPRPRVFTVGANLDF